MPHSAPVARLTASAFAFVALALAGCPVDNSGGPPPAGDTVTFEIASEAPGHFCDSFADEAYLLRSTEDIDAYLEACNAFPDGSEDIEAALDAEVEALLDGQAVLLVSAQLGGCLGDWHIESVHLDGETLRPWMLKDDGAYGRTDVACTADIGQGHQILIVDDVADAADVELTVGHYNADLPGAPTAAE